MFEDINCAILCAYKNTKRNIDNPYFYGYSEYNDSLDVGVDSNMKEYLFKNNKKLLNKYLFTETENGRTLIQRK